MSKCCCQFPCNLKNGVLIDFSKSHVKKGVFGHLIKGLQELKRKSWNHQTLKLKGRQGDTPGIHRRHWRQASMSSVNTRAVSLTTFPFCVIWIVFMLINKFWKLIFQCWCFCLVTVRMPHVETGIACFQQKPPTFKNLAKTFKNKLDCIIGLILGLRPANERRRYFVMTSLIGWTQT